MEKSAFTYIDLFSGIGGFKMALGSNGGSCLGFSEISRDAINVYCENFRVDPKSNFGDITKIKNLPEHDVLVAGVPCQSWSIAGKNLGFDDDRGQLWNDTIFLLHRSRPKTFIFENVKGLVDPRNRAAMAYILGRIKEAGYHADYHVINSHDYGVAQNRVRVYIVGFLEKEPFDKFSLPKHFGNKSTLSDILGLEKPFVKSDRSNDDLFGNPHPSRQMSLSSKNGYNDYFLFNDLRNGRTTIHSWDISETTDRQKEICLLLLKNRRKSQFGPLDGNPLSIAQFQSLDPSITKNELLELVGLDILKVVDYRFEILKPNRKKLSENENHLLDFGEDSLALNDLKTQRQLKIMRIPISDTLNSLLDKNAIKCIEQRFDFKNGKISSGLNGINRIFMPTSDVFPTLVASDTNDYVSLKHINPSDHEDYKDQFLKTVYFAKNFRKISRQEACMIQGFPQDFKLPEARARWMKLIGNSVSVPVIDVLIKSIISTGVFSRNCLVEKTRSAKALK